MKEKFLNILLKKQSGEATETELKELQIWLDANVNNEENEIKINAILQHISVAFETYQPDTESKWELLSKAISEQPEEIKVLPLISSGLLIKAAAAIAILFGLSFFFLKESKIDSSYSEYLTQNNFMLYYLPDSSVVRLNKNSRLTVKFSKEYSERKVVLSGEAFFEVTKDPSRPFIVETEKSEIKVLGTSFNVLAIPGSETTEVEVIEGKVEVRLSGQAQLQNSIILVHDEKIIYHNTSGSLQRLKGENENFEWWLEPHQRKTNITF
jgi:transmembrane sensor